MPITSKKLRICDFEKALESSCNYECRTILENNQWAKDLCENCLAAEKIHNFILGKTSFHVALSAFRSSPIRLLEKFMDDYGFYDVINYFLQVEIEYSTEVAERLSEKYLYQIFKQEFSNYSNYYKKNGSPTFFEIKANRFWTSLSAEKVFKIIYYFICKEEDPRLAAQFLTLIPAAELIDLKEKVGINYDEEIRLFIALDDDICLLARSNPYLFEYLLEVFKDEVGFVDIFKEFEKEAKFSKRVDRYVEGIHAREKNSDGHVSLQWIFNELTGLPEYETSAILSTLKRREVVTESEASFLMDMLFPESFEEKRKHVRYAKAAFQKEMDRTVL